MGLEFGTVHKKFTKYFYRAGGIPARFFLFIEKYGTRIKTKVLQKRNEKIQIVPNRQNDHKP